MSSKPNIVFFGSGPVGLASLQSLAENFEIEAVITKPNPKSSRAPRLVAEWAEGNSLTLHQPESGEDISRLFSEQSFSSRVGVAIDYGFFIGNDVIESFELGIVNSHFSLLPEWRGADPITFSLLSGQEKTGVSLMMVVAEMDEGDLLSQEEYVISVGETIDTLTNNLIQLSNQMLQRDLPQYLSGELTPTPQSTEIEATYSRRLDKSDGEIDWSKLATQLEREIRAYQGWPGSFTTINDLTFVVTSATVLDKNGTAGQPFEHEKQLAIYCGEQALLIEKLKPAGKQEMDSTSFLNGYKII